MSDGRAAIESENMSRTNDSGPNKQFMIRPITVTDSFEHWRIISQGSTDTASLICCTQRGPADRRCYFQNDPDVIGCRAVWNPGWEFPIEVFGKASTLQWI